MTVKQTLLSTTPGGSTISKPVQIGKLIQQELKKQGRSVVWLSQQLYINRSTCYRIFHGNSIDTQLLFQISQLLNVDFFALYSKFLKDSSAYQ